MINGQRVIAIIPARSGSKGLPGKNIRPLLGVPLLAWPVAAARASHCVDRVIVSTDSADYADIGRRYGAEVPFLRPALLAADTAPSSAAVLHVLDTLQDSGDRYDLLVLLEPTSPLTDGADIDGALTALCAGRDRADALVGVTELATQHPAFAVRQMPDGRIQPYAASDFTRLPRRQDVEPLFALDGSLYISAVPAYRKTLSFCHDRTLPYPMARHKSHEVDDLVDFLCIETIARHFAIQPPGAPA
ncbi:MAG: cytidylyltransferase domain-containing protein [Aquabacterium sp.]